MSAKRILLAEADPKAWEQFRQALGAPWEIESVADGKAALEELAKRQYDVLVAALDLPEIDGAELLNQARNRFPQLIRFVLAAESDRERVVKGVLGAHQFLTKPFDQATLRSTIEHALAVEQWIANDRIRELATKVRSFPTIPSLYLEVLNLLRSPSATTEDVGEIIAKDMAMMTKLLQVINSAYFGLPRRITDPAEAVGIMGFETVKSLVMSVKFLSQYNTLKPGYFSLDRLWQHSTDVARTARELVLLDTNDRSLAADAFTAGLLHDLGKVVLAANFDDQYNGAHSLARKQHIPLWEIEKEIFGAGHGEIGAYLFGLWGMPLPILEAAAFHHTPSRTRTETFTPLTAVHVANVLECELHPGEEGLAAPKLDEDYLAAIGCGERLALWRESVKDRTSADSEKKPKPAQSPTTRAQSPAPGAPGPHHPSRPAPVQGAASRPLVSKVKASSSPHSSKMFSSARCWAYAAVAVLVLLTALWVFSGAAPESQPVKARTLRARPAALAAGHGPESANTPPEPAPTAASNALAQAVASTNTSPDSNYQSAAIRPPPAKLTLADLRLQGVIFSSDKPSAIINGRMLWLHDWIAGARLTEIGRTNVTMEDEGRLKTLFLK